MSGSFSQRQQASICFLVVALLSLITSSFLLHFWFPLYLTAVLFSALAFGFGLRRQRLFASALFVVSFAVVALGYRQELPVRHRRYQAATTLELRLDPGVFAVPTATPNSNCED